MPQLEVGFMKARAAYFPRQERDGAPVGRAFVTWLPPGRWTIVGEEEIEVKAAARCWDEDLEPDETQIVNTMRLVNGEGKVRYIAIASLAHLMLVPMPRKRSPSIIRLVD